MSHLCSRRPTIGALTLFLAAAGAHADTRLATAIRPTFQAVELKVDPSSADFSGRVRIELRAERHLSRFRLQARGLEFQRLEFRGPKAPLAAAHTRDGELVTVETASELAPGDYTLEIDFTGHFGDQAAGLYRTEKQGAAYVVTQFEPADARAAFPCFDEPGFKQPWQVTLEVPAGQGAYSNTPVEDEQLVEGQRRVRFARTRPLPSYLVALAVGPFEAVPIPGLRVPGQVLALRGEAARAERAARATAPLLNALEAWFERPYPYEKLDLVAVPDFWPSAMENPGLITFKDRVLLQDPATSSIADEAQLYRVIAHELAHQWFGNLVTMAWWDDLWLNESFADWLGDKLAAQVFPQFPYGPEQLQAARRIMSRDARPGMRPIRPREAGSLDAIQSVRLAYDKGKAVLGMFESWMGPENFRRGVIAHIKAHEWGLATSTDLWDALGQVAGRDLPAALRSFVEQPGLPLIEVRVLSGGRLRLSQRRFLAAEGESENLRWRVPLTLAYSDGGPPRSLALMLTEGKQTVQLPVTRVEWLFPDQGGHGYYRYTLDERLIERLLEQAPSRLSARERIALVANLEALLAAGRLGADRYLAALERLARDAEPEVVRSIVLALEPASRALVADRRRGDFAAYVRRLLSPALTRIGAEPRAGESVPAALLRPELLLALGKDAADPSVLELAQRWAALYFEHPEQVDPTLAEVALELAAWSGDRPWFDRHVAALEDSSAEPRRRLLAALGCYASPELQARALRYVLDAQLPPEELFLVPPCLLKSESGVEQAFEALRSSFGRMAAHLPPPVLPYLPRVLTGGCSMARIEGVRDFLSRQGEAGAMAQRGLAAVAADVADCARLRARESRAAARYLERRE